VVPRTKSSLLWGVVGVLAFLAAAQAYQLVVASLGVGLPTLVGIAVVVGTVVTVVSYVAEYRLTSKGRT
jgi:cation transporter-like permease